MTQRPLLDGVDPKPLPVMDFSCRECGKECDSAPDPPARAVCPDCCPDHDYRHVPEERGHRCLDCGRAPDPDWYDED